ncbi:MAG: 4Fe-4S binding protein [Clostridia bacterium]|nr:4Fe-4S binding protein [Clostridia bacterium]
MSKNWYPVIDTEKCVECGTCVEMCKHGVYKKGTKTPIVVNEEGCIEGCKGCGKKCPSAAIEYIGDKNYAPSECGCGLIKDEKEIEVKNGCECASKEKEVEEKTYCDCEQKKEKAEEKTDCGCGCGCGKK